MIPTVHAAGYGLINGGHADSWNPGTKTAGAALTDSDRTFTWAYNVAGVGASAISRRSHTGSGKYYWEMRLNAHSWANNAPYMSLVQLDWNRGIPVSNAKTWTWGSSANSGKLNALGPTSSKEYDSVAMVDGDIIQFAVDIANQRFWCGKNGTWLDSFDPAAGTNRPAELASLSTTAALHIATWANGADASPASVTGNFAYSDWVYAAPSGFTQW